jgi:hypothetical protein
MGRNNFVKARGGSKTKGHTNNMEKPSFPLETQKFSKQRIDRYG